MELWDLYTADRTLTGQQIERGQKVEKGKGLWAITGGSVIAGENSEQGLIREIDEELGIQLTFNEDFKIWDSYAKYDCIFDIWVLRWTDKYEKLKIVPGEEVSDYKWASKEDIFNMIENGNFHDYKKEYFNTIFNFQY